MADKEIGDLTAASALDGTETVHVVQGGNSRRTTTQGIADLGGGAASLADLTDVDLTGVVDGDTLVYDASNSVFYPIPLGGESGQNPQSASYTLADGDSGKLVYINNAAANNITVPPNSSVAFPIGTRIDIGQYGAGQTTIVAGSGVTIRSSGAKLKLTGQYSGATLQKIGTDEWWAFGDLTT